MASGSLLDVKSGYTDGTVGFGVDASGLLGVALDTGKGRHVGSSMIPSDSDNRAVDVCSFAVQYLEFGYVVKWRTSLWQNARLGSGGPTEKHLFAK